MGDKIDRANPFTFRFSGSNEGKRMGKAEQDNLIKVFASCNMLLDLIESDKFRRIDEIKDCKKKLKTSFTLLKQATEALVSSMPHDQAMHLARQYGSLHIMTYIGCQRDPISRQKDQGRWLSFEELNTVGLCCRECCKFCTVTDKVAQRKCPVKKFMDTMPIDRPESDGCGWMEVLGSIGV